MTKILIVEDNEENRISLKRRLRRRGFHVVVAIDGQHGIDAAKAEMPDLILMDMNMPVIDGWQATMQIRAESTTAHIPIIAVTGHAEQGDLDRAIAAGCADYHMKPVKTPVLAKQIEAILTPVEVVVLAEATVAAIQPKDARIRTTRAKIKSAPTLQMQDEKSDTLRPIDDSFQRPTEPLTRRSRSRTPG